MELLETQEEKKPEGPSVVVFVAVCAVITLLAGGAGFGVSATMLKPVTMTPAPAQPAKTAEVMEPETTAPADPHGAAPAHGAPAKEAEARSLPENLTVVDIPAVTTNLLDPPDTWIRLELSLAYDGSDDEMLSQDIQQDILAYIRTVKLYNLRGGSGYQHLIEDLNDRAAIRSEGRVKRVLVRSFVLQ